MRIVISLGGSVIIPNKVDLKYLHKFKKFILKNKRKHKIVIVTGGGKTARNYITALEKEHVDKKTMSYVGIFTTRLNAMLIGSLLNVTKIPTTEKELKKMFEKESLIVTGALGYHPNMTSDGTAAEAAKHLRADMFVNITNVDGLYTRNPKKYKNANLVSKISFSEFNSITKNIKFKAGQHFVLDQHASKIILKAKIKTIIINRNLRNLDNLLKGRKFIGTVID